MYKYEGVMKFKILRSLGLMLFMTIFVFLIIYGIVQGDPDFIRMESATL